MTSRYDGIIMLLNATQADSGAHVVLSFAAIERVVGPLPRAAREKYPARNFWGLTPHVLYREAYLLTWWHAGWRVIAVSVADETVTFERIGPALRRGAKLQ